MDIKELLRNNGTLEQLAQQFGLGDSEVENVLDRTIPEISRNIKENASTEDGLSSFLNALQDHKDAPVDEMLTDVNKVDTNDGEKILAHIFGNRKQNVEQEVSQKQGISSAAVGGLMKYLAPLLMGIIAKQLTSRKPQTQTQQNDPYQTDNQAGSGASGKSILDSILGTDSPVTKKAGSMFDKNGDGSFLDDLLGGLFKK